MSTTTVAASILSVNTDIGFLLTYATGLILVVWAALLGLGWATRHFKGKITGRKF